MKGTGEGIVRTCRGTSTGRKEVPQGEKKPLRPAQCRAHVKRELAHHFREIVDTLVERAKGGSFQHTKLAIELLEARPGEKEKARRKGPGPLTRMLREIERMDAEKKKASSGVN